MKNKQDFKDNPYTARARMKPETWDLIKDNYRKHKKKSAAELLDHIAQEYFKPNLFKKNK